MIKVSRLQQNNPALQVLKPNSYRFVDSCANVVGGGRISADAIVEDFQINATTSVLFLSLDFHIKKPLYIKQRFEEVYKYTRRNPSNQRLLLLLHDSSDEVDYLTGLQVECAKYEIQMLICWSFEEAGQYLRTLKAYESRTKTTLQGKSQTNNPSEKAVELLSSVRRINNKDANRLLAACGSLSEVICTEDYNDFMNIDGIAQAKIESLRACFKSEI